MYKDFALIYDELMKDFNYNDWAKYIIDIWKSEGLETDSILEMACGTGNLTEIIGKNNIQIDAFDLSEDMLSIADSKLKNYSNVNLYKQDMKSFKFNRKYKSIISICDSINYITEDLNDVFSNVYNHLEDGGLFIFDINSSYKLREVIGENIFINEDENIFYTWENNILDNKIEFYLNFFIENDKGFYERFDELHYQRIYEEEEIIDKLKKEGFRSIDSYKAFSFEPADKTTERINFVARK